MEFEYFLKTLHQKLNQHGVRIEFKKIKDDIMCHPYYPSIQSITDLLIDLNIPVEVIKCNIESLKEAFKEVNIIILTQHQGNYKLRWIENIKENIIYYSNGDNETLEELINKWDGTTILLQIESQKIKKKKIISYKIIIFCLLLFIILFSFSHFDILNTTSMILKFLGIYIASLLISMSLGFKNSITNKICSLSTNDGCKKTSNDSLSSITKNIKIEDLAFAFFCSSLFYSFFKDLLLLATIELILIPFILFLFLYQLIHLKSFCPLCILLSSIIFIDIYLYYHLGYYTNFNINNYNLLDITTFTLIIYLSINIIIFIKKYLKRASNTNDYKYQYYRLLRSPKRISDLVLTSETYETKTNNEIILGDTSAFCTITEVISPYCSPCGESLNKIIQLLNIFNRGLRFKLIFISKKNDKDRSDQFIRHILSYSKNHNQEEIIIALHSWFKEMNFPKWSLEHSYEKKIEINEFNEYLQISKKLKINYTPTIFLNNRKMDIELDLLDLRYYIDDHILE